MTVDELVDRTRERLNTRERRIVAKGPLIQAAVLVPIVDRGEPWLVFAKRTERVGHHKGQISFPGGVVDPTDASMVDAALRECEEEISLPRDAVEVLGTLDDSETVATPFVITPFVGVVRRPCPDKRQKQNPVAGLPDGEPPAARAPGAARLRRTA